MPPGFSLNGFISNLIIYICAKCLIIPSSYPKIHFSPWLLIRIQFINIISSDSLNISFMTLPKIYYLQKISMHLEILKNKNLRVILILFYDPYSCF